MLIVKTLKGSIVRRTAEGDELTNMQNNLGLAL